MLCQHTGRIHGKFRRHVTVVITDRYTALLRFFSLGLDIGRKPLVRLTDRMQIDPVGARPQQTAHAGRTEFDRCIEGIVFFLFCHMFEHFLIGRIQIRVVQPPFISFINHFYRPLFYM